jgi:heme/copper-type cytochrome/quinol oxidase subunit 2
LTSAFKGKIAQIAYKVIGVLVILLGLYNIANSYGVVWSGLRGSTAVETNGTLQAEKIQMTYTTNGLQPTNLELEMGKSYEILIDVQTTVYGCMSTIFISGLDKKVQSLQKGTQIAFHVQPTKAGTYEFLCAMGVPHGASVIVK